MPVLTRRAALAQKSLVNVLPNELTTEIISFCTSSSQAALCRVSKHLKQLAHQRLYRIVCLQDNQAVSFDKVLSDNPQYAGWVKSLTIDASQTDGYDLTSILESTTELLELSLSLGSSEDIPEFARLLFPGLVILNISGNWDHLKDHEFSSFLNRHPTISHLSTIIHLHLPFCQPIDLPNLTTYQGLSVDILTSAPKLRCLYLVLIEPDTLDLLVRFPECHHLAVNTPNPTKEVLRDIFNRVNRHFPNVKSLALNSGLHLSDEQEYKTILVEGISGLKQLTSFGLFMGKQRLSSEDRDSMIGSWLKSRPTLQECLFLQAQSLYSTRYRCKVVQGKPQVITEPCWIETGFKFF
ncbi:hypothetical protein C8J56DRAFT_422262 [Mycena floridula]|nr:hypothetical protein C8J56DRAFT_422262 [Mycena floridula]